MQNYEAGLCLVVSDIHKLRHGLKSYHPVLLPDLEGSKLWQAWTNPQQEGESPSAHQQRLSMWEELRGYYEAAGGYGAAARFRMLHLILVGQITSNFLTCL